MQFYISVGSGRSSRTFAKFDAKNFKDALKKVTWKQVLDGKKEFENDGSRADSVDVTSPSDHKLFTLAQAKEIIE